MRFAPHVTVALGLLIVAGWLLRHPYMGIQHDALLYSVQVIAADYAPALKGDLFLAYGSQDAYTLFTPLLSGLFAGFGVAGGAKVFVAASHVLWVGGAWALASALTRDRVTMLVMILFVFVMSPAYGVKSLFSVGEGFATPRVLVEALTLFAFAYALQARYAVAVVLFLATVPLHPIMAACGFGLIILRLGFDDWRWFGLIAAGCVGLIGLAVLELGPFAGLFIRMDPVWLDSIRERNFYLFPGEWGLFDWFSLLADAFALLGAATVASAFERRTYLAGFLGIGLGVAATVIGVELFQSVFVIQAQPYRIFWITHVLSSIALGRLFISLAPAAEGHSLSLRALVWLAVGASALSPLNVVAEFGAGVALALLVVALSFRLRARTLVSRVLGYLAILLSIGIAIVLCLVVARLEFLSWPIRLEMQVIMEGGPLAGRILPLGVFVLGVGLVFCPRLAIPVALIASALVIFGVVHWDRRANFARFVEAGDWSSLTAQIPEGAAVYQEGNAAPVWLGLKRQTWFSITQGAGLAFVRETAMEYARRREVSALISPGVVKDFRTDTANEPDPVVERAALVEFCSMPDAPHTILMIDAVRGATSQVWPLPAPTAKLVSRKRGDGTEDISVRKIDQFHIYRCADHRG